MDLPGPERRQEVPIPEKQVELMKTCFQFHASKRITMDGVVANLNVLVAEVPGRA